jgi:hypothetical protein
MADLVRGIGVAVTAEMVVGDVVAGEQQVPRTP